ncbi:MAG TPA: CPBP family intramembrane glutamic endopeptidase [Solirubrobacteraceae bacterium]
MSSPPSSVPPPSFGTAPELPAGVERPARAGEPGWRPWTAWVGLVAAFGAALVAALVIGVGGAIAGSSFSDPTPAVNIVATMAQDVCLVAAALLFAGLAGRPRPVDFGLRPTHPWRALGWMVLAFAAFFVFTAVWVKIVGGDPSDEKLPEELGADDSTVALLAVAFLVAVVAPVAEEFFFRGFFYGALRNWRGVVPAALLTGLVFGAIHAGSTDVEFLVPLAFFGFALCLLRERTGSLYPCIVLHCANNSLAFGISQEWTWQIPVLFGVSLTIISLGALLVRARWEPAVAAAA